MLPKMHRNYLFHTQQASSQRCASWAHGKEVAHWQEGDFRGVEFAEQGHVTKDVGITSIVECRAVLQADNKTDRDAGVNRIIFATRARGMIARTRVTVVPPFNV